jgi:acetolactate synthase I/III small subunit
MGGGVVMSHVLSMLVEDKPGLLTRVAGLFARRGFNIESLAVGKSEIPGLSRITVVVDVEQGPLEQVTKQLNKLINVIKIVELDPTQAVEREHLLIKVKVDNTTRSQILEAANLFRARIVDVSTDALVIEVTGDTAKTQALLRVLEPYGIREIAQSGLLAMGRGPKSITERVYKN